MTRCCSDPIAPAMQHGGHKVAEPASHQFGCRWPAPPAQPRADQPRRPHRRWKAQFTERSPPRAGTSSTAQRDPWVDRIRPSGSGMERRGAVSTRSFGRFRGASPISSGPQMRCTLVEREELIASAQSGVISDEKVAAIHRCCLKALARRGPARRSTTQEPLPPTASDVRRW